MKPKRVHLNLNGYRNWQFHLSNQLKVAYKEIARPKIQALRYEQPISLTFTLWKATKRKIDRANPLCVHEKFFCDALVECDCIDDDNDTFIFSTTYLTGGIDRENPRVDITIDMHNQ